MIVQNDRLSGAGLVPVRGWSSPNDDVEIVENVVGPKGDTGISVSIYLPDPFVFIAFGGGNGKGQGGEKGDRQRPECTLGIGVNTYGGG